MKVHREQGRRSWLKLTTVIALAIAALTACSLSSGSGGGGVPTFGKGVITAKGSVFVNGIEFDTSGTKITVNDSSATDADLKVGMVVEVKGSADAATGKGSASAVLYSADIDGPVGAINVAGNSFTVFGRSITVDATTMWEGVAGLSALSPGDRVEVSGSVNSSTTSLKADRVYKKIASAEAYELKGTVGSLAAGSFTLTPLDGSAPLTVNFSGSLAATIVNGSRVEVRFASGGISGSTITTSADMIRPESHLSADEGSDAELGGRVSGYQAGASTSSFNVDGVAVSASNSLLPAGFADGMQVEVRGRMSGGVLVAASIKTEREANAELRGRVASIDAALSRLVVNGVTLTADSTTRFKDENDSGGAIPVVHFGLSSIAVGDYLEASGFYDSSSTPSFVAEKIERKAPATLAVVKGPVSAKSSSSLTILGLPVDISAASFKDASGVAVANGTAFAAAIGLGTTIVEAKGSFNAGSLAATEASIDD